MDSDDDDDDIHESSQFLLGMFNVDVGSPCAHCQLPLVYMS